MRISVALATYNGARFLREQLDSLADQTMRPAELVVSDDGSTDATVGIFEQFAAQAPFPVRLVRAGRRLGFSDNFLFAAGNCQGELVAFCDQDDVWCPGKLETGYRRLVGDDSLLSLHRLTLTDGELRPIGTLDQGIAGDAVFEPLHLDPYTTGWGNTLLFRRTLLDVIPADRRPDQPGMTTPLSHDNWIYVLAAALGRVSHIHEPLILYRQHGGNAVGKAAATWRSRLADITRDPTTGFAEKMGVDAVLCELFAEFAARREDEWGQRAECAAARYALRVELFRDRAASYAARGLRDRLTACRRAFRAMGVDEAATGRRRQAGAKDLVLGVTGLAALRRQRALTAAAGAATP